MIARFAPDRSTRARKLFDFRYRLKGLGAPGNAEKFFVQRSKCRYFTTAGITGMSWQLGFRRRRPR